MSKVEKFDCDCSGGTTSLTATETVIYDANLVDGRIEVSTVDSYSNGFMDFVCSKCGAEVKEHKYDVDIIVNN